MINHARCGTNVRKFCARAGTRLGPSVGSVLRGDSLGRAVTIAIIDCQFYVSIPVDDAVLAVDRLVRCLNDVDVWMKASRQESESDQDSDHVAWIQEPRQQNRYILAHPLLSLKQLAILTWSSAAV